MSAPTTFGCPHCAAQYPIKPVLVGKVVRCTSCKNPFRLRPDGFADKVEAPVTTTAKAVSATSPAISLSAVTPVAPAPAAVTLAPAAASSSASSLTSSLISKPTTPRPTDPEAPVTRRLAAAKVPQTQQQIEARKAMADSLSAMAGEALQAAETTQAVKNKEESSRIGKSTGKPTGKTSSFTNPGNAQKKAGKGPAILTNEGEREAENSRQWLLAFIALIVVIGGCGYLVTRVDTHTAAVHAFTAELPSADNRFGRRAEAIQARAWSPDVIPFIALPAPRLGSERTVAAGALAEALAKLAGLVYVPAADRWIGPDKVEWLNRQVIEDAKTVAQRLEKAGIINIDNKAITQALRSANLSDEELTIINTLLMVKGPLAGKLATGPIPVIRWCTVRGTDGTWLFNPGGDSYKPRLSNYDGLLVAFTGEGWPADWRFLTLNTVK